MTTEQRTSLLDAIDAKMTEPTAKASVYLDGASWSEANTLRARHKEARHTSDGLRSEAPKIQAELDQVLARLAESELVFTFRQLPKTEYADLVDDHPSDNPEWAWDDKTFPPALVAASCIGTSGIHTSSGVSAKEVVGLWERLGQAQTDELFRAAFTLQLETPKPFMYAATEPTTGSGPNSTTASSGG